MISIRLHILHSIRSSFQTETIYFASVINSAVVFQFIQVKCLIWIATINTINTINGIHITSSRDVFTIALHFCIASFLFALYFDYANYFKLLENTLKDFEMNLNGSFVRHEDNSYFRPLFLSPHRFFSLFWIEPIKLYDEKAQRLFISLILLVVFRW